MHRIIALTFIKNKLNKPWVLDPVAIGIGELRTDIIKKYKEYKPSIIRGNASEINTRILNLKGIIEQERGVEGDIIINGELNSERGVIFRKKV